MWFWVFVVVGVVVAVQALIAVSTYDDACARSDTPRTWNVFPPGWECHPGR
jgi:hypothetical protein